MAFHLIRKSAQGSRRAERVPRIRMSAHQSTGVGKPRSIGIFITETILTTAGIEPYANNHNTVQNLAILEGSHEDAGFLTLVHDVRDGYACTKSKSVSRTLSIAVAATKFKHYVLNECPAGPEDVEFTIDPENHSILIQCPDWLRYNPQSVEEEQPVKQRTLLRDDRRFMSRRPRA